MNAPLHGEVLICFAVPAEARPAQRRLPPGTRILVTGMGLDHTRRALSAELDRCPARAVLGCGFAGGLDPALPAAAVVVHAPDPAATPLLDRLTRAGARPAVVSCVSSVAVTVADKRACRARTGADAVDMESAAIAEVCRARGLPWAIVRAISDPADEPLPVDFNALMTPDHQLPLHRLLGHLVLHPGALPGLIRLGRRSSAAAQRLADVLHAALA